jgi:hypothetical protein
MNTALALATINHNNQATELSELQSDTPFFKPVNTNALAALFGEFDTQSNDIKSTVSFLKNKHQALSTLASANLNSVFGTPNRTVLAKSAQFNRCL